jgi:phage tail sheath gpL-like
MATSTAVSTERISRIVGYQLLKGDFSEDSPNLPQRIAIIGEANTDNQTDLDTTGFQIVSAQQAGERYGYGSPIHIMARIILSSTGGGVGGIPVVVYPQVTPGGATAKVYDVTPSGVATGNGTHTLVIGGREGLDSVFYNINVNTGDTHVEISAKISDAVNNVLGSPMIGTEDGYSANLTSKWKGLTADDITVSVDDGGNPLGITYAINSAQSGSGTPTTILASLNQFQNDWVTIVVNGYGTNSQVMTILEAYNGIPDPTNPTGRFVGIVMKPFIALTGSVADDPSSITDTRLNNVTIAICPAPNSAGLPMEAAANMAVLFAIVSQNTPHLDVAGKAYPDMPTPTSIGSMSSYDSRDQFVKKGCSTVDLVAGQYIIQDFVTTYHPVGEMPPQFRYCRNLMIDSNVRFTYYLQELINVVDHAIAADDDIVVADKVIKPKQWKAVLKGETFTENLAKRALIADVPFTQNSIKVNVSTVNPDRLETFFKYKRTGFGRILSTSAEAGFNFGTLN